MDAPRHLQYRFEAGQNFLVLEGKKFFMASKDSIFSREGDSGPVQFLAVDLQQVWTAFCEQIGDRTEFKKSEVATAAGVTHATIDVWRLRGFVFPTVRASSGIGSKPQLFSVTDTFAASLCGCLRRLGVKIETAGRAALYACHGDIAGVPA